MLYLNRLYLCRALKVYFPQTGEARAREKTAGEGGRGGAAEEAPGGAEGHTEGGGGEAGTGLPPSSTGESPGRGEKKERGGGEGEKEEGGGGAGKETERGGRRGGEEEERRAGKGRTAGVGGSATQRADAVPRSLLVCCPERRRVECRRRRPHRGERHTPDV